MVLHEYVLTCIRGSKCDLLVFLGSVLTDIERLISQKMNDTFPVWDITFFQNCSKCNFIMLKKRTIVWGIKRRNRIFWEATSSFIAPFIDFSSHQKTSLSPSLLWMCVCGFLSEKPLTSPLSLSLSSSHPPLYSFCCPSNRLIHATHLSSACCKEYSSSVSTIGRSTS